MACSAGEDWLGRLLGRGGRVWQAQGLVEGQKLCVGGWVWLGVGGSDWLGRLRGRGGWEWLGLGRLLGRGGSDRLGRLLSRGGWLRRAEGRVKGRRLCVVGWLASGDVAATEAFDEVVARGFG